MQEKSKSPEELMPVLYTAYNFDLSDKLLFAVCARHKEDNKCMVKLRKLNLLFTDILHEHFVSYLIILKNNF